MPVKPLPQADLEHVLAHARHVFAELRGAQIFLTGGTGFFGHWLVESLLHADRALSLGLHATILTRSSERFRARAPFLVESPAITLLEGDIRSFPYPAGEFSHIIHAATDSGGQQADQPAYALADSILGGTRRVLELSRQSGSRRLLYVSTGAVYGRSSATETHIPETSTAGPDPLLLRSSYDEAKRMSEHLCVAYTHGTSTEAIIARPFAFVGPHLPLDQHFAIGNFIGAAITGTPIHIHGDGTPVRSWLYMADLAIWLWHLLVRGEPARAYNVGSEDAFAIADAAHLAAETLRPGLRVQIDGTPRPAAPMNSYVPSTERARQELGLVQTISLPEALRRTAAWHGLPYTLKAAQLCRRLCLQHLEPDLCIGNKLVDRRHHEVQHLRRQPRKDADPEDVCSSHNRCSSSHRPHDIPSRRMQADAAGCRQTAAASQSSLLQARA